MAERVQGDPEEWFVYARPIWRKRLKVEVEREVLKGGRPGGGYAVNVGVPKALGSGFGFCVSFDWVGPRSERGRG